MSNCILPLCTAAFLTVFSGTYVGAAVIESSSVAGNVQIDGAGTASPGSPVASKTNTQTFTGPGGFSDVAFGSAVQNENGFSEVEAKVSHVGIDGLAANGTLDQHRVDSLATRTVIYTNTSATTAFLGTFDFTVSGGFLETFHAGGGPIVPQASIGFFADVTGGDSFSANMTLTGNYNSHTNTEANGFSGSVVNFDCFMSNCLGGRVNVDTLTGSLNLGVLAPGETRVVTTLLTSGIVWNGTELGAQARLRDPNGATSYSATFTPATAPPVVPLPAGGVLLLTALGLGGLLHRRARRAV